MLKKKPCPFLYGMEGLGSIIYLHIFKMLKTHSWKFIKMTIADKSSSLHNEEGLKQDDHNNIKEH